jgi:hypothetical protein
LPDPSHWPAAAPVTAARGIRAPRRFGLTRHADFVAEVVGVKGEQ